MVTDTVFGPSKRPHRRRDVDMPDSAKYEIDELIDIAENIMGDKVCKALDELDGREYAVDTVETWLCKRIMHLKRMYHPNATIVTRYGNI